MQSPAPSPSVAPHRLAPWQRVIVVASALLIGPALLLMAVLVAFISLPAIALAFPFFLASTGRSAPPEPAPARRHSRLVDSLPVPSHP